MKLFHLSPYLGRAVLGPAAGLVGGVLVLGLLIWLAGDNSRLGDELARARRDLAEAHRRLDESGRAAVFFEHEARVHEDLYQATFRQLQDLRAKAARGAAERAALLSGPAADADPAPLFRDTAR